MDIGRLPAHIDPTWAICMEQRKHPKITVE